MQTERVAIALRPRQGWEALDLGFAMVRAWWRPLFGAWLLVVLPCAALIHLLLYDHLWLALLAFWWLKPLYDRVALSVLSDSLFGDVPTVRQTLARLPGRLRGGLAPSLLWLRFSPLRALQLPVLQLEGQRGAGRRRRTRVLAGRESHLPIALQFACLQFELVFALGLLEAATLFTPDKLNLWGAIVAGEQGWARPLVNLLYVFAVSVVEPFYVAGGFGFYINRRVYLEGWDIDLTFRKLAGRVAGGARAGALPVLALALGLLGSPAAYADGAESAIGCEPERAQDARRCIDAIFETPEFSTTEEIEYWWPRGLRDPDEEEEELADPDSADFFVEIARLLARLVRTLSWVALALAAVWLVAQILRARAPAPDDADGGERPATRESGVSPPRGGLPGDPLAAARERWAAGDPRAALSLLYRAALLHLTQSCGVELPVSATEGECDRITRGSADPALARDFSTLTRTWQFCAYAGRRPDEDAFRELCSRWATHLDTAP